MADNVLVNTNSAPIDWPRVTFRGQSYFLRLTNAAYYQLSKWGIELRDADNWQLAAAALGSWDHNGKWRSVGFARPLDLVDELTDEEIPTFVAAFDDLLKKVSPKSENLTPPTPATETLAEPTTANPAG